MNLNLYTVIVQRPYAVVQALYGDTYDRNKADLYIAYVKAATISAAIEKAQREVHAADKREAKDMSDLDRHSHEWKAWKEIKSKDYKYHNVFDGHPKIISWGDVT